MGDGEGNFNGLDEGLCCIHFCVRTQSLSRVQFFVTPLAIAHQASLPMEFSRQEYWSGLPFPSPGDLANPGIKLVSSVSPELAGGFFYH